MEWSDVEAAIRALRPKTSLVETRILGVLLAAYKTGADAQRIAELTGYKLGDVHDALGELQTKMLVMGKQVAERDILRVLPGAQPLLQGLLLNKIPAVQPVELKSNNQTQEVAPMEVELCTCGRTARHRGYCKGKGPKKAKATPAATASKPTVTVSGVSFSIRCETDGQKYEASGSTLDSFNAAMNVVGRMLGA